jgi:predicted RNA polymerase sigma factor
MEAGMDARHTVEAVWRMHSARLVASLAQLVQDLGLAEEVAQDAFLYALQQWPERGVPDDPAAWLMTIARRRAIDLIRRERSRNHKYAQLTVQLTAPYHAAGDDDLLSLVFVACHPAVAGCADAAHGRRPGDR